MSKTGVTKDVFPYHFMERYEEAYREAIQSFINFVINKSKPSPSLVDGRNSLVIAEALTKSAKLGKKIKVKY